MKVNGTAVKLFSTFDLNVSIDDARENDIEEVEKFSKRKKFKAKPLNVHVVYSQVKSKIEQVKHYLENDDKTHALLLAEELINTQLSRKDHVYASMSLCQLSENAKSIGDYSLQLEWAKKATDINPQDARSFGHLADSYLNLYRLDDARKNFEYCSDLGEVQYGKSGLARVERARYNYDLALSLIDDAISYNGEYLNYKLKAELFRDIGRLDDALSLYDDLRSNYPEEPSAMCGYASVLVDLKNFDEAEKIYRKAFQFYPDSQLISTSLGFLLARKGKFKEAIKYLDIGISNRERNDFVPFLIKAKALQIKGDYANAEMIYETVISKNNFLIEPWYELIEMCSAKREFDKAKDYLSKAEIEFNRGDLFIFSRSIILKDEGEFQEALSLLDKLKSSHPKWIKALSLRADVLKNIGNLKEARSQYSEILSINSYNSRARIAIKLIDVLEGVQNVVEPKIEISESMVYEDWENINIDGLLLLESNKLKEAKSTLIKGYNKTPFKPIKNKLAVSLAVARNTLGQYATALKTIKNINTKHAVIQKIIINGELGKAIETKKHVQCLTQEFLSKKSNLETLVSTRYVSETPGNYDEIPGLNEVLKENIREMLLAA